MKKLFLIFTFLITQFAFSQSKVADLTICYYHQDSLKVNYKFYREQDSIVKEMQTQYERDYQKRANVIQDFITKNNDLAKQGMLSEIQLTRIQEDVQRREQAFIVFQETETKRIQDETTERLEKIYAQMEKLSKEFCEKKKIDLLLVYSKEGQVVYITPKLDVTKEFIVFLNKNTK